VLLNPDLDWTPIVKRNFLLTVAVLGVALLWATSAFALPALQIYIEGATYDNLTESWVSQSTGPIRLWTVAAVGDYGSIMDVKLAIAYESGLTPSFALSGSSTGGYNGFADPSTASDPTFNKTVTDGSAPVLGDGSSLPTHGIYGSGTTWSEYLLGNFTETDSYIADFNGSTDSPTPNMSKKGQINVYEINVAGVAAGTGFHFDLYDHYYNEHSDADVFVNAPFSHDGDTTTVPEPGTLALVGMGVAGLATRLRRRVS
jgi:hypothetical protein